MVAMLTFTANARSGRSYSYGAHSVPAPLMALDADGTSYILKIGIRKGEGCLAQINPADQVFSILNLIESIAESSDERTLLPGLIPIAIDQFEAATGYEIAVDLFARDGTPVMLTEASSTDSPF